MNTTVVLNKHEVVVDRAYFEAIQKDSEFLEILDSQCVHLWSGYSEAVSIQEKYLKEAELNGEEYRL
jgi:hypothetical protein